MVCGEGCMRQIYNQCEKSIIEPVMSVEISFPAEFDVRVMPLLAERNVEVDSVETDYLVSFLIEVL